MGVVAEFEKELFRRAPAKFGQWHAIDLHNHSPSSFDYRGDKAKAVELSADQILKSGVSIIMFTDHEKLPDPAFTTELTQRTRKTVLNRNGSCCLERRERYHHPRAPPFDPRCVPKQER